MESLVKLLAIGVGIASLSIYLNQPFNYHGTRITQMALMGIVGVVYLAAVAQRIRDKELFALGFIVVLNVGHIIMLLILILSIDPGAFIFTYAFLMILGEFIKVCFLFLAENIEVTWLSKNLLFVISGVFIIIYLIILILQVVIWLTEYNTN